MVDNKSIKGVIYDTDKLIDMINDTNDNNLYYKNNDIILKSNQFNIICTVEGLPPYVFHSFSVNEDELYLTLFDIDYLNDSDAGCIPLIISELYDKDTTFDLSIEIYNSNNEYLYTENYYDVIVEDYVRYGEMSVDNNCNSKFKLICTYDYKDFIK